MNQTVKRSKVSCSATTIAIHNDTISSVDCDCAGRSDVIAMGKMLPL